MPQVYHIVPATVARGWLIVPLVIVVATFVLVVVLVGGSLRGARKATFTLSPDGLRISGDVYGRMIPANELRAADARRAEIGTGPLRPTMRVGGTAVPGYRSGWFRLANGEKALLYVTDVQRVVYVPTTAGYSLLLSVAETDPFLQQLHAMAHP